MSGLRLQVLTKTFPPNRVVLRQISFTLVPGNVGLICGANGAGKSTLLRCCSGVLRASSGEIARGAAVAYVGEADYLYADATVAENLCLVGALTQRRSEVEAIADEWQVRPWWGRCCGELSLGQRRRVALARAWLAGANLVCLDEPLRGLDAEASAVVRAAILRQAARGGTVLMATQSPDSLQELTTRQWQLRDGVLHEGLA